MCRLISAVLSWIIKVVIKTSSKDFTEIRLSIFYLFIMQTGKQESSCHWNVQAKQRENIVWGANKNTKLPFNLPTPFQFSSPQKPRFYITNNNCCFSHFKLVISTISTNEMNCKFSHSISTTGLKINFIFHL